MHYFYAYLKLVPDSSRSIDFSVPSGAGGHITAGVLARLMGLPAASMQVAVVRDNDIFAGLVSHSRFERSEKVVVTLAPSMDIQVSVCFPASLPLSPLPRQLPPPPPLCYSPRLRPHPAGTIQRGALVLHANRWRHWDCEGMDGQVHGHWLAHAATALHAAAVGQQAGPGGLLCDTGQHKGGHARSLAQGQVLPVPTLGSWCSSCAGRCRPHRDPSGVHGHCTRLQVCRGC